MGLLINFDQISWNLNRYNTIESFIKNESQFVELSNKSNIKFKCGCGYIIHKNIYNFCPICGRPIIYVSDNSIDANFELTHRLILRRNGY